MRFKRTLFVFEVFEARLINFFSLVVTVPLVAWRNSSGQFLNIDDAHNGTLGFSNGEQHNNAVIPKSEQLFLFVPHPGNYEH
jgi:hypothetical protein